MPRSPDGLIPKQCVASHQDLRPHSSQSEDSGDDDDAGDGDDNGDGDDHNGNGDGDGATQLGGEHDGVGGTKTQSCGGLCIQTSGGLQ